ncbi:hypothetical protein OG225_13445 [Nocardia sp. NBC_01377]
MASRNLNIAQLDTSIEQGCDEGVAQQVRMHMQVRKKPVTTVILSALGLGPIRRLTRR